MQALKGGRTGDLYGRVGKILLRGGAILCKGFGVGKYLAEQCFAVAFDAGRSVRSAHLIEKRESEMLLEVPAQPRLLVFTKWIGDFDRIFRTVDSDDLAGVACAALADADE